MQTPGVQILVVDDEAEIRALLRRCFEREGYQVLEAKDGAEFRACIEQAPISLITLDLTLGGEDGLELARRTAVGMVSTGTNPLPRKGSSSRIIGVLLAVSTLRAFSPMATHSQLRARPSSTNRPRSAAQSSTSASGR